MSAAERQTRFRVEGMDCASCATKIDTAVRRLNDVADVKVSVVAGTMTVTHGDRIDIDALAKKIGSLGYKTVPITATDSPVAMEGAVHRHGPDCDHDHAEGTHNHSSESTGQSDALAGLHGHDHGPSDGPWWKSSKARLTILCGAALAIAFGLAQLYPQTQPWGFVVAMAVGLVPIARRALFGALNGSPFTIETLMTVAAVGAVIIDASEEAAVVVFLFLVGELLEGIATGRARASIRALATLMPKTALLEIDGATKTVPAESLTVDAIVLVRPGDRVPADGVVLSGESAVDEAPVTGESVPKRKEEGDNVFAGTVNQEGVLRVRVTAAAADNTIARIITLVEEAQETKAPTERFIDRFSRYYTPGVMVVAALIAIIPPLVVGAEWATWIYRGLAVLLIGCPCALVISTPAAIAAALSAGARRGLLMKGGSVLENLGKVNRVAFDKTGTLTEGKPKVTDIIGVARDERETLRLAAALEVGSSHPLAVAILAKADSEGVPLTTASEAGAVGGKGVVGTLNGEKLFLASPRAAAEEVQIDAALAARIASLNDEGKTVSVLLAGKEIAGLVAMRDEPREDAKEGIALLRELGADSVMLTGDNTRTAKAIAASLGMEARAELMPQDKQRMIGEMRREGRFVAKVGDGINDAPALAAADIGIAMGGGTDVALETADAAILHGRVKDVANMVSLSRLTMSNIWQNIVISLGLKAVFLVTTVLGITGLWPAILADTGATVLVTANAMRLLAWRGIRT
ncbi:MULTISPECIES: heavy metal translocating P-type ATPase [Hyphomicrobiales]|jgi:Cd2+/Zn2+-exporting ATPase|uniref:P-type Zn(2+) transporter n=2 Tax=Brucella TaxID=234 RepID=A0A256GT38_9HYPH|nr:MULTISPECIES: heavy metal translocating P-type ATPase [Brucella]KAB2704462.1 cadmium-translocating P-type ATPase [Brucella lupini]KAB2763219.1 cadmium-translocating P-type ATPase [Brucella anthropi]OYR30365.1 copper-translocating P-type ATPase [Brucella lupini]